MPVSEESANRDGEIENPRRPAGAAASADILQGEVSPTGMTGAPSTLVNSVRLAQVSNQNVVVQTLLGEWVKEAHRQFRLQRSSMRWVLALFAGETIFSAFMVWELASNSKHIAQFTSFVGFEGQIDLTVADTPATDDSALVHITSRYSDTWRDAGGFLRLPA